MQARTSRIMRFSLPHDPDGRPCLPIHHRRSQRPWPHSPTPNPSTTANPRTCSPAWPASLTRELPVAAATRWWPSWAWRPPRSWPGRGRSPRSPNGPPPHPSRSGPRSAPAAMAPTTTASRPRPPSAEPWRAWMLTPWPAPSAPGWPTRSGNGSAADPPPACGGRRRRQDPTRRQRGHRRRPPSPPVGLYGPRQPRGAGPTPGRRRARRGARLRPTAGRT
jgi:hypothetical protein